MAFNGSGVHNRVHDWTQDLANTIPVTASRMDAEHDDISSSLSNTICRDGQSTTTARIPFASGVSAAGGTTASVAYAQTNDNNTGLYFPSSDQWGLVAGGTATLTSTSTKVIVAVAIDFSGAAAPTSSDGAALGSTSQMWSDLFLASGAVINFNNGDATLTHSSNTLTFAGATNYVFDAKISPLLDDGAALGDSAHQFSDLHLASGAVTSWNNGDVTLTHSSNALAIAGGSLSCEALSPSGNVAINTDKFTVAAASGNTVVGGTLGVAGLMTGRIPLLHVRDQKSAGTNGGTATSGSFEKRTLNMEVTNEITGASLNTGTSVVTLPAGSYEIEASSPASFCNSHVAKWRNTADGTDVLIGTAERSEGASSVQTRSFIRGRFTIAGQKTFELQHRVEVTRNTVGQGYAANLGVAEVYADVWIKKVA